MAPYVTVKHAVVGMSMSLREEAKAYGVNVTVVCPFWIDTPILDSTGPDDLPKSALMDGGARETAEKMGIYSPQELAQDILRGIDKKRQWSWHRGVDASPGGWPGCHRWACRH